MTWINDFNKEITPFLIKNAPMKDFTTYQTGGLAQVLALPQTQEQILYLKDFCQKREVPLRILGLGSNILVSQKGLEGLTCCLKNYQGVQINATQLCAKAGTPLDKAAEISANNGLAGIECLSGIPGSCGGAVYMNAGAFNQETFDALKSFKVIDNQGNIKDIDKEQITYAYRKVNGIENHIILQAVWNLKPADKDELLKTRRSILSRRAEKQPLEYPSAGSVFKRPQGDYASRLIDICGLRGLSVGGAMVSTKHAGFIINYNNATADDIFALISKVQYEVKKQTGIALQREQILWGEFDIAKDKTGK